MPRRCLKTMERQSDLSALSSFKNLSAPRLARTGCRTRIFCCARVKRRTGVSRAAWVICSARVGTARRCGTWICGTRVRRTRVRSARVTRTRITPDRRTVGRVGYCRWIGGRAGVMIMIKRHRTAGREEHRTKQDCIFLAHDFLNPSMPNTGRSAIPIQLPAKAITNQSQPCTLPEAMPLNNAPILQPNASRAP